MSLPFSRTRAALCLAVVGACPCVSADATIPHAVDLRTGEALTVTRLTGYQGRLNASCIPGNFWELDQASADALAEILPVAGDEFDLRFDTQTSQLQSIAEGDIVIIPQTTVLPTGHQGPVLAITTDATDITLRTKLDRFPDSVPAPVGDVESTAAPPDAGDPGHECMDEATGFDTDFDQMPDSGDVAGRCEGTNGGEQGFRFTLAEGVEINGLASVSPFEIDAQLSIFQEDIDLFRVTSTSRLSFTGEISAEADYVLPDDPWLISGFPVATYQLSIAQVGTVNISLEAKVLVGACGVIQGGTRAGLSSSAEGTIGLEWLQGEPPRVTAQQAEADIQISPPELDDDTGADITLYGGAILTLSTDVTYGGFLPVAGANIDMTARGNVNLLVQPTQEPWWQISGTPEVYVDVVPELLFANLAEYNFQIVDPEPEVFFTSQNEFPFNVRAPAGTRGAQPRRSGDAVRWSRAYLAATPFVATDVSPTNDGGAIVVGHDLQVGTALKTDFQGNREWQRRYEGNFMPASVVQLLDGGYAIAGRSGAGLWVARLDAQGNTLWSRDYDFTDAQVQSMNIERAPDGQLLLGGALQEDAPSLDTGPWAARLDLAGDALWARRYGQSDVEEDILGMAATGDGGLILVGQTEQTPPGPALAGQNAYTLRLASDGTVWWSNVWASSSPERLFAVSQAADGSYLAGGFSGGNDIDTSPRGLLIRYRDEFGGPPMAAEWIKAIGPHVDHLQNRWDQIKSITATRGGFVIAGNSLLGSSRKSWLAKISERVNDPDMVWSIVHDGIDQENIVSVHDLGDGLLLGGDSVSFAQGALTDALWVSRLPYEGYMHWNDTALAAANYTQMVEDIPPSYPDFAANLNVTGEQHTTSLEQSLPLGLTVSDSTQLVATAIGFVQRELVREPLPLVDADGDNVDDDVDNCTAVANPDQRDTNGDGFGNLCDADLNDDFIVNALDLGILKLAFFGADADADLNGDGIVNVVDLGIFKLAFFAPPGPSGLVP